VVVLAEISSQQPQQTFRSTQMYGAQQRLAAARLQTAPSPPRLTPRLPLRLTSAKTFSAARGRLRRSLMAVTTPVL
jgi:hypothetical protein